MEGMYSLFSKHRQCPTDKEESSLRSWEFTSGAQQTKQRKKLVRKSGQEGRLSRLAALIYFFTDARKRLPRLPASCP